MEMKKFLFISILFMLFIPMSIFPDDTPLTYDNTPYEITSASFEFTAIKKTPEKVSESQFKITELYNSLGDITKQTNTDITIDPNKWDGTTAYEAFKFSYKTNTFQNPLKVEISFTDFFDSNTGKTIPVNFFSESKDYWFSERESGDWIFSYRGSWGSYESLKVDNDEFINKYKADMLDPYGEVDNENKLCVLLFGVKSNSGLKGAIEIIKSYINWGVSENDHTFEADANFEATFAFKLHESNKTLNDYDDGDYTMTVSITVESAE